MAGRGTPATVTLDRAKVRYRVHEYEHDPAETSYGLEAVVAMGQDPGRVFKTLLANVEGGEKPGLHVAVLPVAGSLDLKALAAAVGGKRAAMADAAVAERTTGYVRGGISPLGQRRRLPTVVDVTATERETVFFSAGRRGLEIELAPADLVRLTRARVAAITAW